MYETGQLNQDQMAHTFGKGKAEGPATGALVPTNDDDTERTNRE